MNKLLLIAFLLLGASYSNIAYSLYNSLPSCMPGYKLGCVVDPNYYNEPVSSGTIINP